MMKQLIMLLILTVSTSVFAVLPQEDAGSTLKLDWFWQNESGSQQVAQALFTRNQVKQGVQDQQKINFTLNSPIRALHGYIGPRLMHVLDSINSVSPDHATKFVSIEHAFSVKDASPESTLFWQAYYQYQDDAFNFLRVSPCLAQNELDGPCIRPNYSQIFYSYRQSFSGLAEQLRSHEGASISIQNAQSWLLNIPDAEEHHDRFSPPLTVLLENVADSDERALLLATLISQIAPDYRMFLVYPANSNGSASPAWLTIEARSGANGTPVVIDNNEHTLLTGSPALLKEMMTTQTPMISEPLY
ncbi:hypothetical protein K6Y31_17050 [Motilimonas cestriensis]|uniref:Uncharacterized protein n=1 Tax=Motilimonas cestriensis TaxID=2742685 RepID=A0ABS8WBV9_9GAMM|nr:hypothetical protein [Motilimonas cestriensis]MCE2596506.1 hypothetical protein [Motilimonas cestriensis]